MSRPPVASPLHALPRLTASDVLTCGYLACIGLLASVFTARLPQWWWYSLTHTLVVLALLIFLWAIPAVPTGWVRWIRCWYPALFLPPIFSELEHLVHPINPVDIDVQLIAIDLAMFGVHPTVWLERYTVPWLTEYLQLAYISFYFLPFALCVPLYRRRDWHALHVAFCALLLTYYTSYLLYFLTPARGPRFYLATAQSLPLTGLWLTTPLQSVLDHLEGIQRDAFPSGHTAIALVVLAMAARYQRRGLVVFLVLAVSVIISTVYLRYHYAIDVIAGGFLAVLCLGVTYALYPDARRLPRTENVVYTPSHVAE